MQQKYPLKIQSIRSHGRKERLFVHIPVPLAVAIGMQAGEQVQWELIDRCQLHLLRLENSPKSDVMKAKK